MGCCGEYHVGIGTNVDIVPCLIYALGGAMHS